MPMFSVDCDLRTLVSAVGVASVTKTARQIEWMPPLHVHLCPPAETIQGKPAPVIESGFLVYAGP
jgi:hypothetical protein